MAPPACARCGSLDLAVLGEDLRRAWAAEEGVQWNWEGNLAYWRLCLPCHREVWPEDRRNPNGSSRPWSWLVAHRPSCTKQRSGKACLVLGDFSLTQPPPELVVVDGSAGRIHILHWEAVWAHADMCSGMLMLREANGHGATA